VVHGLRENPQCATIMGLAAQAALVHLPSHTGS
jgi:hypothetical protein